MITIPSVIFGNHLSASRVLLQDNIPSSLIVQVFNPDIPITPAALTVSVNEALGPEDIIFEVNGVEMLRVAPDSTGTLELVSVPLPPMDAGSFSLVVKQGATSQGTAAFTVYQPYAPPPVRTGPDAPPVQVPGAIQPNGVRRWVLQDLAPGGLGSWVMPLNPQTMGTPAFSRELTVKKTTASVEQGGQYHITEDAFTPVPWEFSGYLPTEEMYQQLEAYRNLNRRFYLHDHRGRAWKVIFEDLQPSARLTQYWNGEMTHAGHDYQAVVQVLEREWTAV
jgi:hypothetical protein